MVSTCTTATAQKLLQEVLVVLDTMNTLENKTLRDELFATVKKGLHTVNDYLRGSDAPAAEGGKADGEEGADEGGEEFEEEEEYEEETKTVIRCGAVKYRTFLTEIIPLVRQNSPGRAPKVNLTEAADLWRQFKHAPTVEEAIQSAREALGRRPMLVEIIEE